MARKKKNSKASIPAAVPDTQRLSAEINRINSIVSESLGIGVPGSDPMENIGFSENVFHGSVARKIYRALDIVQRIIDSPAKDALRAGYKIKTNHDDLDIGKMFIERLDELNQHEKFRDYLIFSRLYSRGVVLFPVITESGMVHSRDHLRDPLKPHSIERIEELNVIHEDYFHFHVQSFDPLARNWGEIEQLLVNGADLHRSRFKHCILGLDITRQRGISMLDRIIVACKGLNIAEWTISNLLLRYRALLLKYPAQDILNQTEKDKNKLKELIRDIKMKFTSKSVAAVPSNYEFQHLETSFTGIKEATDYLYEYLSSVTSIPQSIIRGSAKGEVSASEKDQRDYYETVQSEEQENKLKPLIMFLTPYILWESTGEIYRTLRAQGINPDTVTIEIEFNPMHSVNPIQDAQKKLVDSQRGQVDLATGVRDSDEIRKENYPTLEGFAPGPSEVDQEALESMAGTNPLDFFASLSNTEKNEKKYNQINK